MPTATRTKTKTKATKSKASTTARAGGWKTCSRGHNYRGVRCPTCWPGGSKKS